MKKALLKAKNGEMISESDISKEFKESFNKFICLLMDNGQTCTFNEETHEFEYFPHDFLIWYWGNEKQIKRIENINNIIDRI